MLFSEMEKNSIVVLEGNKVSILDMLSLKLLQIFKWRLRFKKWS